MKPMFTYTQAPFLRIYLRLTSEGRRIFTITQLDTMEVSSYASGVVGGIVGGVFLSWR